MGRILIVDDERPMRRILASNLAQDHHLITEAGNVAEARSYLASNLYEAVITDQKMPDGEGLDVLAFAREVDPSLSVVLLTAFATVELAVESMRQGAFDFITKPFEPEVARATASRACEHTELLRENGLLRQTVVRLEGSSEIFGESDAVRAVRDKIARVAPTNATVLITGETGTGKDLVARAIHRMSPRFHKPLIAVNCAAFTETLLEDELFGHDRGAFTGADRGRPGLFEAAHEGTLFLDEAGEMSLTAQSRLLRVLTAGEITRLGSSKARKVDVRVLVATHRDLEERVRQGLFRQDLFYRLAVVPIAVPPLRARRSDIPGLCQLLCRQAAIDLNTPLRRIHPAVYEKLLAYDFPGNIRELRNLIEQALILAAGDEMGPEDFHLPREAEAATDPSRPDAVTTYRLWTSSLPETVDLRALLEQVEMDLIARALKSAHGVQAAAARRLHLSRSDLAYKISKHNKAAAVASSES